MLERAYFSLCLVLGRLLRSAKYSNVVIGAHEVRKRRLAHAPLLVWMGGLLVRLLDTGVRVLPRRDWEAREREVWRRLRGASIAVGADGSLVLPRLRGTTLAAVLEDPGADDLVRGRAIELAVVALADFHALGFTHGDAMAENVMVDLEAGVAHWFDFETVHDARRSAAWRRADDVRALLVTCVVRMRREEVAAAVDVIVDGYADEATAAFVRASLTSVLRRPLPFHLGQAGLSLGCFGEVARVLCAHPAAVGSESGL